MRYIDWILPLNVKNTLKRFLVKAQPIQEEVKEQDIVNPLLEKNKVLNNSVGDNKTCYILACGPSINEMDLSVLKGKDCISVSNFFVHPLYQEIQPKYHVFAPTHEPITEEQYNSWIADFQDKTRFDVQLILNAKDKPITDSVSNKGNIKRFYYELTDKMPELYVEITLDKPLPRIQTVVHLAIYTAIALGYKEINLLGVDHDWLLHYGESRHFYEEKNSVLAANGYVEFSAENDLENQFRSHLILWGIYKSIQKYSSKQFISVFNLNKLSFLDVFPKKNIL